MNFEEFVVGAYPASAAHKIWQPELEKEFFELLEQNSQITTLEIPWLGSIHPHDDKWLLNNFPRDLKAIITSIPFVMSRISKDVNYGVASLDEPGRQAALADIKQILAAAETLNQSTGASTVSGVEIHTAPRKTGDVSALAKSLEEICSWELGSINIYIEHCDAWVENQVPEKGFLSLVDEISAIEISSTPIGIVINWGRSAIEFRNPHKVLEHINLARESGHLSGVIFSGASDKEGVFGNPWIDAHQPFKKSASFELGDSDSLLTREIAYKALSVAGPLKLFGIKMGWPPNIEGTVSQRYELINSAIQQLSLK